MTLEQFLVRHGLLALALIATVEGDLSLVVAGVLTHLGLLPFWGAVLAGASGNLAGDLAWFAVGHRLRERITRTGVYRRVGPRVERLARRFGPWQLLASRVVYGTRNVSMLVWGHLGLSTLRFLMIDGLGCLLAGMLFVGVGFGLGHGTSAITGEVKRLEHWLAVAVIIGGMAVWAISRLARRELDDQ
jgi:membrane protein DedA with SNARE-associated domain